MNVVKLEKTKSSPRIPRVLAITGGKGGVGKTSVSVNLAIALARTGSKVCLFDADTGLANINVMLGLHPAYTLEHLFTGEKSIHDILLEGPAGIDIIPGASGFAQCVELGVKEQRRLVESISELEPKYDYMLVDTAAGISPTVLHFIAASQIAAVVITPEPTSLTDAFSLLKVLRRRGYRRKVEVIVNMASNARQADKVYRRFEAAVKKYLGLQTEQLGALWMDESMRTAVSLQRPVTLFSKEDPSAKGFYRLAEKLDNLFAGPKVPKLAFSSYWKKLVERSQELASKKAEQEAAERARYSYTSPYSNNAQPPVSSPDVSRPDGFQVRENKPAMVVDLNSKSYQESLSQVQKQILAQNSGSADDQSRTSESEPAAGARKPSDELLSDASENAWVDLRIRMNRFFTDPNTTPEQVTTLISSCIYAYGDRLGDSAIDLLHGLLSTLTPASLNAEHRLLLSAEYERLGLADSGIRGASEPASVTSNSEGIDNEVIEVQEAAADAVYDERGFGSQASLAEQIRSSSNSVPLETLLESIKYASLVDSSQD
ncbi:hypothetical protein A3742_15470 [Oleiphilus sp. HI0071]|jgi:MinD-like ATPase involved in chromosome partitioning or flagellar assembly|uniref:MinD/ParA family ATP-binding protein n=2 Tax=Oleiphilus TaxID=141450 RepID=UPI0007C20905|nr:MULTISPECIES: MinD/ParA family protein [unclassified Oleiphilus]KZY72433.1 hypothetical protein A3737_09935 [Oleiphilus sp. HI0065]KZY90164.1 hypothetical protein A3742_15470 [Oleiphilus sp. HI0071]KZZ04703.1 hypothetical protein A3744_08410 [Oleiphilus sp. HI0073]KZZ49486.1 hypothetical protein A3760_15000 [Oleiphilus sp. HI0122]KZZ81141.1 hypothetical protein A3767_08870 [Oleiphilus sp. HI0133]